jgi:2-polyprenyl-3-methyl-5-hydroxy-6-metoxy-1,4-benzoquinol methylase
MKNNFNNFIAKKISETNEKVSLGNRTSYGFVSDPTSLLFRLSRYKFVSRMFEGFKDVLEVGAGDGFKSIIVKSKVKNLLLSDIEITNKEDFENNEIKNRFNISYILHNFEKNKLKKFFDGIYMLDVFEHINKKNENIFLKNIIFSLKKNGSLIVGIPSLESQKYASKFSKLGHVNCKTKDQLKKLLKKYFHNVFLFSMNDEVLHTGYGPMSHYLFVLACSKIK